MSDAVDQRLAALGAEHDLPGGATARLRALLEAVAAAPASLTSVRAPARAVDVHVADSLSALTLSEVRAATRIADLGSGGGFPGLPLAFALPDADVALVESVTRKSEFLRGVVAELEVANARVVPDRVEEWAAARGTQDVVCARALAPLSTLVEYAAPLLRVGGVLVAWKGRVDGVEEADGASAATAVGMTLRRVASTEPFAAAGERRLYVYESLSSVPKQYPRRPGMARKRPLRASGRG